MGKEKSEAFRKALKWMLDQSTRYRYSLLDRMREDCEYFLGKVGCRPTALWAGDVDAQIAFMKAIWESFEVKPEWLSMEQIEEYERKMK